MSSPADLQTAAVGSGAPSRSCPRWDFRAQSPCQVQAGVSIQQAALVGGCYGGGPISYAEFGVDVNQVCLEGGPADDQLAARSLVGGPPSHQPQHLELARAQAAGLGGTDASHEGAGD